MGCVRGAEVVRGFLVPQFLLCPLWMCLSVESLWVLRGLLGVVGLLFHRRFRYLGGGGPLGSAARGDVEVIVGFTAEDTRRLGFRGF
ncbi:hypothetical protein HNY73_020063 [Argiope bruennichi]|uniref:Uncharacterized protein n=1 Tax=Argiope bruennichi TaxID=94029 RepID=A0A8T0E6S8_ARGBR|nr:hypothetical protein HNY73_020063 [Argiope bruennichi]